MSLYTPIIGPKDQSPIQGFTFDEAVEFGLKHGANVVDGVPWAFNLHGIAFTHETNNRYTITAPNGRSASFELGLILFPDAEDGFHLVRGEVLLATYKLIWDTVPEPEPEPEPLPQGEDRSGVVVARSDTTPRITISPESLPTIHVRPSPTADTRTCDVTKVTKEQLLDSSRQHIADVGRAMAFFVHYLNQAASEHDFDKLTAIDQFYADFQTKFEQTGWWTAHRQMHRHHLGIEDGIPEQVNLLDVLEYIADCVMAGTARSGSVYPLMLDSTVLARAFENTVALLTKHTKLVTPTVQLSDWAIVAMVIAGVDTERNLCVLADWSDPQCTTIKNIRRIRMEPAVRGHGADILVWFQKPAPETLTSVRACLATSANPLELFYNPLNRALVRGRGKLP